MLSETEKKKKNTKLPAPQKSYLTHCLNFVSPASLLSLLYILLPCLLHIFYSADLPVSNGKVHSVALSSSCLRDSAHASELPWSQRKREWAVSLGATDFLRCFFSVQVSIWLTFLMKRSSCCLAPRARREGYILKKCKTNSWPSCIQAEGDRKPWLLT